MQSKFDSVTKIWSGVSFKHPYPMNFMFSDFIYEKLCENSDRIVQISESDNREVTLKELKLSIIRVAQNLSKIDINEDDVVGLITHQSNFATFLITGCVLTGAIINPLDASLSESDIRHVFNQTKPKIIICDNNAIPKLESALNNVDFNFIIYSTFDSINYPSAQKFLQSTGEEDKFSMPKIAKPSDEKIMCILCSSGTTGSPKGVSISHANCFLWLPFFRRSNPTVSLCFSPPYWGSGFFRLLTCAISQSDTQIITKRSFSVETLINIVERYKVTTVTMPPSQFAILLNSDKFLSSSTEGLQTFMIAGSVLSKSLRQKFEIIFPNKILMIPYGMTEISVSMTKPQEYKHEFSVGSILFPNIQIKIVDDEGKALENNQKGEIYAKGGFKFIGYYNNIEATRNAFDEDDFVKTGDIGYFNDEGMLFVIDRKKDILKYKGYQLNPSEIEEIVQSIEGVELVSVVGIPDDMCAYLLTAAVVKRSGFDELNEKYIIDYVASKMPEYKQLHGGVYFMKELPMTPSGKIQKRLVLEKINEIKSGLIINE